MNNIIKNFDSYLEQYIPKSDLLQYDVIDAMRYSLLGGGKRIRAALLLEFNRICGGDIESAIPFACAIEMIHASSLIHDDLPCMDDDDMRRGKPSCHRVFGEAVALLAGDALIVSAFETMLNVKDTPLERIVKAALCLGDAVNTNGMIGGQVIDLMNENNPTVDEERLRITNALKTGKLIAAACEIGCIIAGATEEQIEIARRYAKNIGLAFQMIDDVLDMTGNPDELGKPVGSDMQQGKVTYASLYGVELTRHMAIDLVEDAKSLLHVNDMHSKLLIDLANQIVTRNK